MRNHKEQTEKTPKHEFGVRLGAAIREVREHPSRAMTRSQVINVFYKNLFEIYEALSLSNDGLLKELKDFADAPPKGENWLGDIERGEIAKLPRLIIDLLLDAMECDALERARILSAGGYDPFAKVRSILEERHDQAAIILIEVMLHMYEPACHILQTLLEKDSEALQSLQARMVFMRAVIDLVLEKLKEQ